jgi:hypothetical protein
MSSFSLEKSKEFLNSASQGNLRLVETLSLDPQVNLNWKDSNGWTAFFSACIQDNSDVVRYLLDYNQRAIDYNSSDDNGSTPFKIACLFGELEVVKMLLDDERIDVNRPDNNGSTPLYSASYKGHVEVVKAMLASERQIDTLKQNRYGESAADIARRQATRSEKLNSETEDAFQESKKGYQLIVSLLESHERDPRGVRAQLRIELGFAGKFNSFFLSSLMFSSFSIFLVGRDAGELFALIVYLSDRYLRIDEEEEGPKTRNLSKKGRDAEKFMKGED